MDFKTATTKEIKDAVLEDGKIDAEEAKGLRERLYADGKIDKEEADFLFELNDAVSGADNAPEWKELFVEALTDYVLADDETPGEVDEAEATYLISQIDGDGQIDECEKALLLNIKAKATKIHPSLEFKIDIASA